MARKAPKIELTPEERAKLESILRRDKSEQRMVIRVRIVLLAGEGLSNEEIIKILNISKPVVIKWRRRFAQSRMEGLSDAPRLGRPRIFSPDVRLEVATEACCPPKTTTHWSTRDLAKHLETKKRVKMSHMTIQRILAAENIKLHLQQMWIHSDDPDFDAKMLEIVGLYMNPPENAVVLCVDEKTGMQALGRKHKGQWPVQPGQPAKMDFEYKRHGTCSLLAAMAVHQDTIHGECFTRHTHKEFLSFLKILDKQYYGQELHFIVDNLSVHKHQKVKNWLSRHKNIHFHWTPTHGSWLNQIELWFNILSRKVLKRGIFSSVEEMVQKVMAYIKEYNRTARPFAWTYSGDPLKV